MKKIIIVLVIVLNVLLIGYLSIKIHSKNRIISEKITEIEQLKKDNEEMAELLNDTVQLEEYLKFIKELNKVPPKQKEYKPFNVVMPPPYPQRQSHYYIDTTNYSYDRPIINNSGSNTIGNYETIKQNEEYRKQRELEDNRLRLQQLEDKVQFMQWGIDTY